MRNTRVTDAGSEKRVGDAASHGSQEKSEGAKEGSEQKQTPEDQSARRRKTDVMPTEEKGAIAPTPKKAKQEEAQAGQRAEESVVTQQQKDQHGETSAATAGEGSSGSAAAPRPQYPRYPPYPRTGKVEDLRKWSKKCDKVNEMIKKTILITVSLPCVHPRTQAQPELYRAQKTRWWFCVRHAALLTSWMMGRGYHDVLV